MCNKCQQRLQGERCSIKVVQTSKPLTMLLVAMTPLTSAGCCQTNHTGRRATHCRAWSHPMNPRRLSFARTWQVPPEMQLRCKRVGQEGVRSPFASLMCCTIKACQAKLPCTSTPLSSRLHTLRSTLLQLHVELKKVASFNKSSVSLNHYAWQGSKEA